MQPALPMNLVAANVSSLILFHSEIIRAGLRRLLRVRTAAWLPTMDLNHDKQIQSLLCYRYTSRQTGLVNGRNSEVVVKVGC